MNPYDEGTPEWLIYETEGEDDSEPVQFPRVHGLLKPPPGMMQGDMGPMHPDYKDVP